MSVLNARCKFHLNEKALKRLKADAEKNGMNRSEYARYLIRSMPVIPFPKYDLSGFIREANEIGQIVNNCAVKLRTTGIADVDDIIDCFDRLHRLADRFFPLYEARSDEIWKDKRTCNLSNGGRKYEMEIRMTKQEKEDFDRQVKSTFLTRNSYFLVLLEGKRNTENPPKDYFDFFREMEHIECNIGIAVIFLKDKNSRVCEVCEEFLHFLNCVCSMLLYIHTERVAEEREHWGRRFL